MTGAAAPPAMLRRAELEIVAIRDETRDTRTYRLGAPPGGLPVFRPGQFFALEIPDGAGQWIRRSYSVASAPLDRGGLDFTIQRVAGGAATTPLFDRVRPGDRLRASGPFGEFVLDEGRPALFVAGGVGVTPILSMLRTLDATNPGAEVSLLYTNRDRESVIAEGELRGMAGRRPRWRFRWTLTRADRSTAGEDWGGELGRFGGDEAARAVAEFAAPPVAYLCGPIPMMEELGRALVAAGMAPGDVRTEAFFGTSPTFSAES